MDVQNIVLVKIVFANITPAITWEENMDKVITKMDEELQTISYLSDK